MPFDVDWKYVFRRTMVPFICLAVSVAALVAGLYLEEGQVRRLEQLTANQSSVHRDYAALVERRRIVDRYHRRYRQFAEVGFVGLERRLDWIETLYASTGELTLPRVSYLIEPQLTAVAPVQAIRASGDVSIHVSRVELEMSLVHELDLLRFVDELQQKAPGLMSVESCDLEWRGRLDEPLSAEPNIDVICELAVYSAITADVELGGPL